jgi:ubiquinone/menaquinone biosynthesis C-methylase UbiE
MSTSQRHVDGDAADPVAAAHRITAHFDAGAPGYHRAAFDGAGMTELSVRDLAAVDRARALAGPGGRDLLACDVGVGSGRISSRLLAGGCRVVGVDASAGMLDEARRRLGPGAALSLGSLATGLPFASGRFDLVTCLRVVKYLPGWPAALAELARITAPGGVVCVDLANRRSPARFGYPAGMVWPTTRREAEAAFGAAGLEVVDTLPGVHLPDPLWRAARSNRPARVVRSTEWLLARPLGCTGARSWTFITRRAA